MPGPEPKIDDIELLRELLISPDAAFVPAEIAERFDVTSEGTVDA